MIESDKLTACLKNAERDLRGDGELIPYLDLIASSTSI